MTNHVMLSVDDHSALRVRAGHGAKFGDSVMSCFTIPGEFRQLQNEFAILFRRDAQTRSFSALALLGFESGENLYLSGDEWLASYKPAALSVPPFLIGRSQDENCDSQLHIDLDHPRVSSDADGVRIFDDEGHPAPYLEKIIGMLGALDEGLRSSGDFFAALERHDLLEPFALDVELASGAQHRMVGYHLINEEKLAALDPSAVTELHGGGHLEPIYMAIASLANLSRLIESKNRQVAGG